MVQMVRALQGIVLGGYRRLNVHLYLKKVRNVSDRKLEGAPPDRTPWGCHSGAHRDLWAGPSCACLVHIDSRGFRLLRPQ